MKLQSLLWVTGSSLVVALGGCATAPAAIEQANYTVKLMALMEEPLDEYRRTWTALEQSRLKTLKTQQKWIAETEVSAEEERLAAIAIGDTKTESLRTKLLANADAKQAAKVNSQANRQAYDAKIDALLKPLPNTTASVTAAQGAVAKMGTELPKETRAQELVVFAQEVAKGIKDSKKAVEDAKAAADKAADTLPSAAPANSGSGV